MKIECNLNVSGGSKVESLIPKKALSFGPKRARNKKLLQISDARRFVDNIYLCYLRPAGNHNA